MLTLECLEARDLPDAALAGAFITYLAPQMVQTVNAMVQYHEQEAQYIVAMATSEAAVMGPQFAVANLPSVVSAAEAVIQQAPALQMAVSDEIMADYTLLLAAPPNPGEVMAILETTAIMREQTSMLTGVEVIV